MNTKKSTLTAVAAGLASTLVLAACGSSSSKEGADEPVGEITTSKPIGDTVGPNFEKPTPREEITLTPEEIEQVKAGNFTAAMTWAAGGDWTTGVTNGARDKFAELGIEVVAVTESDFDPATQKSDIENVMTKDPDAMITLAADPVASASTYKSIADAGTKLVFFDNASPGMVPGEDYVGISSDDLIQMGQQAADALAAAIGGKGKIAYFYHDAEFFVTNQRDEAFKKTIEQNYPDIEIVAQQGIADLSKAEQQANAVLLQNPDLDGLYSTFSTPPGEGILSALRNNGNTDTKMVSLDLAEPLALDMANDGNVAAIVADEPYQLGRTAALLAAYGLIGKTPPTPYVIGPAITVTKDTLVEGYKASLNTEPPATVMDALK